MRRVGPVTPAPGNRFAPRRKDRAHPFRHGIAGIGDEEILIGRHRVALERRGVSICAPEIAHRPVTDRGDLIRPRLLRRIRRAIKEDEGAVIFSACQGNSAALLVLVDAQPQAIETSDSDNLPVRIISASDCA